MATTPNETARPVEIVFVLDCDNTLLDNDAVKVDMDQGLRDLLGDAGATRFWEIYEDVRQREGVVDLPATFEAYRPDAPDDQTLERARAFIMDFPFAERLYPAALDTLRVLRERGMPVIVSDGDTVYQPRKLELSGLAAAVNHQWVVYTHKEERLDEVMARWPADFYVMIDDKARILAETKRLWPDRFVTVHVRQGHYADQLYDPAPDVAIAGISDLRGLDFAALRALLTTGPRA